MSLAVRKNRYVILPVDFEEAWKVRCLVVLASFRTLKAQPRLLSPHSKRSSGQTRRTNFVSFHSYRLLVLLMDSFIADR